MKSKSSLHTLFLAVSMALFVACNDTLDNIGTTIKPTNDKLAVDTDTLELSSQTITAGKVFSKTKYPILGEYIDPVFGTIRANYAGEFYYPENTAFKSLEDIEIKSVRLTISYASIIGDSVAPMTVEVYKIKKQLPKNDDYTELNVAEYVDLSSPLGEQTFSGKNSTYHIETDYSSGTSKKITVYDINVDLPKTIGTDFLAEYKKTNHGLLKDSDTFKEFFPGVYVTTGFGNSTILNVNTTSLYIKYSYNDIGGSSSKTDTVRTDSIRLNITPEVTQINNVENDNAVIMSSSDATFVKSPAGVYTELTFPISTIYNKLSTMALNQAGLTVYAMPDPHQEVTVKLNPPSYLLLINKDSLSGFFEKRKLPDNITSYIAAFSSTSYSYSFGNIAAMINHYNKIKEGAFDLTYYLVPIDATFATDQYGNTTKTVTNIYNKMMPSAAKIDKSSEKLKLDIIYTNF